MNCNSDVLQKNLNRHQATPYCRLMKNVVMGQKNATVHDFQSEQDASQHEEEFLNIVFGMDEVLSDGMEEMDNKMPVQQSVIQSEEEALEDSLHIDLFDESYSSEEEDDFEDQHYFAPQTNIWFPFRNKVEAVIYNVMFCQRRAQSYESLKRWWIVFELLEIAVPPFSYFLALRKKLAPKAEMRTTHSGKKVYI